MFCQGGIKAIKQQHYWNFTKNVTVSRFLARCCRLSENCQKANMAIAKRDGNKLFLVLQGVMYNLASAENRPLPTKRIKQASAKTGL
ncbi:hypothetical protein TH25_22065 [Thalassospira profundimaris]|uniref:Uncharacterized protein n=1 Tax=Thalassospira profundimaris TaxID=502049 RepID=A0A367WPK2_9PROT|nr:hypothetical protein TH25_22065 [Thalassospira profundimaris]